MELLMASIEKDVAAYEKWLRRQCDVIEADLDAKHRRMRKSAFDFLRATYFRWARTIEALCPALSTGPPVLAVGDIHVENYGTWRDADGRLVWGVNDFDEAGVMPYTFDLLRLTTSATLAPDLQLSLARAATVVLEGYRAGLANPRAVLPDQDSGSFPAHVIAITRLNGDFWLELDACPDAKPPAKVTRALKNALPSGAVVERFASRQKGGGSLGRPRFIAIASWNSGRVVREAKALVPSAWEWAHETSERSRLLELAFGSFRSPDPHLQLQAGFVLRRVASDSQKIEMSDVQRSGLTEDLLKAMAADLASVHAASARSARIPDDLDSRPEDWLQQSAETAKAATEQDYASYLSS